MQELLILGRAHCGVYNSVISEVLFLTKCALFVFRTFLVIQLPFNRNELNRKLLTCSLTNTFVLCIHKGSYDKLVANKWTLLAMFIEKIGSTAVSDR